jgi:hypothetical protein
MTNAHKAEQTMQAYSFAQVNGLLRVNVVINAKQASKNKKRR